ncbi:MAG: glycoside hydrolase family 3 C-terminal domain-containing protein [Ignavibacteriales bacterium]|nr:glycoside hydrolase family 3 C-terminal domain-containing protein [Ignavibacteriales bacterium]
MLKFLKSLFIILIISLSVFSMLQNSSSDKNSNQSNDFTLKVEKILSQLSLDEKISLLHGNSKFTISGVKRLGIPEWKMSDGPHGVREEINRDNWEPANWENDYSTYLPTATALAATWNADLAYKFGVVLGREARARDKDVILGPGVNIHRTPLCGRNFEYFSEDPYFSGVMSVPYIKGVQEQDVAACVKHFALNNQEYERFFVNVIIDERTLREIYLPAFDAAINEGKAISVMSAYNKVDGKWCSENPELLNNILKNEWKFDGVVISDWNGTHSTIEAANAGLDIEMGTEVEEYKNYFFADKLKQAVIDGEVDIQTIDGKVKRILTAMFKTKVFDTNRSKGELITIANFKVAKKVAEEAVVLLKNEKNTLPFNSKNLKTIAVIGENAIAKHAAGGGSSGIKTKYEITPLEGLQNKLNDEINIVFAQGYMATTIFDWQKGVIDTGESVIEKSIELRNEAIEIAKNADVVIIFAGLNHHFDNESVDRENMNLPYNQDELIKEVVKVNPNTVVVLISGSPVDITEWVDETPAIIQGWYAGSEAGNVFADVLFGDVNPSGKLPFTFPKKLEDSPAHVFGEYPGENSTVKYKEGIFVGYRYFDTFDVKPQFAFGHGLSYTNFQYNKVNLNKDQINEEENLNITIQIENVGNVSGNEIIQLYIEDIESSVKRPKKELKGFKKVLLKKGEVKEIEFQVNKKMLSFYDVNNKSWKAEPGKFRLHIGSASDDIRLTAEFELVAAVN